jgi:hypothetical protein
MKKPHCAHCTSDRTHEARQTAFTVVSQCRHCRQWFPHPLFVVFVDGDQARRDRLLGVLRAKGIRVFPAGRVAELERWPVGEVLITDAAHATRAWVDVGVTYVIVLADTDEERRIALRAGASAITESRDPAALLSVLSAFVRRGLSSGSDTIQ